MDAKPECNKDLTRILCFDLYIFAEAHEVLDLQNEIIDVLVDKRDPLQEIPNWGFRRLYKNTLPNNKDPLRRLCIDWSLHDFSINDMPRISAKMSSSSQRNSS